MKITGAGDFSTLTSFEITGARLVTIDAENVLTAYHQPELRPEAQEVLMEWEALPCRPKLAVATNNKDPGYISELEAQLPSRIRVFSGRDFENKKKGPGMFAAAALWANVRCDEAIHIDDQLLSFRGADMAGYMGGVLVKPYGRSKHIGVKLGRALDGPIRTALRTQQAISDLYQNGIDG